MSVFKHQQGTYRAYRVARSVNGTLQQEYFPRTKAGRRQAMALDKKWASQQANAQTHFTGPARRWSSTKDSSKHRARKGNKKDVDKTSINPPKRVATTASPNESTSNQEPDRSILDQQIETMSLSIRAQNVIHSRGIFLIGDLITKSESELLGWPNMGEKSATEIRNVLAKYGLSLGSDAADWAPPDPLELDEQTLDAASRTDLSELSLSTGVRNKLRSGRIDSVDHLMTLSLADLLKRLGGSAPLVLSEVVAAIQRHFLKPADETLTTISYQADGAQSVKEELLQLADEVLSEKEKKVLVAYEGWDGGAGNTLESIGDRATDYGFNKVVTRERIRQVLARSKRKLERIAPATRFTHWQVAVDQVRTDQVVSEKRFGELFGFNEQQKPRHTFRLVKNVAEIFSMDFPLTALDSFISHDAVIDAAEDRHRQLIDAAKSRSYIKLTDVSDDLNLSVETTRKLVESSSKLEFIDENEIFLWRRPTLPPNNFRYVGNYVLLTLFKIFSTLRVARLADLTQAIGRERLIRTEFRGLVDHPDEAIKGIALRSGMFEFYDGFLEKLPEHDWVVISPPDIDVLRIGKIHGPSISTPTLHRELLKAGYSGGHARAIVAYSPFLVHTVAGRYQKEGLFKFIPKPEEIDLARLEAAVTQDDDEPGVFTPSSSETHVEVHIPVTARLAVSGRHTEESITVTPGQWSVVDDTGGSVCNISINGSLITGLKPIIEKLGLRTHDQLILTVTSPDEKIVHAHV